MADYLIHDSTLEDIADAIRAKTGGSSLIAPEDMPTEIASISGGGETATNFVTGTFTFSSNTQDVDISCDFEPDYIFIQGDLTQDASLWGVRTLWIVRDDEAFMYCDTSQSTFASGIYGTNDIVDLNNTSTTSNNPKANYQNNTLTVDTNGNRDYTKFSASVDYRYFLFAL